MEPREEPGAGPLGPEDGVDLHRIVGHRDQWWHEFSRLAVVLAQAIPDVVAVEHIGSTAIPGMPARDILDVEVIVTKIEDEEAFSAPLRRLGFRRFDPPDLAAAGLRLFVPDDGSGRAHVHVCERDSAQHRRHVAVRDYLRAHPDEARRYAAVKREAARLAAGSRVAYSRAKDQYLQALEQAALRWNESLLASVRYGASAPHHLDRGQPDLPSAGPLHHGQTPAIGLPHTSGIASRSPRDQTQ